MIGYLASTALCTVVGGIFPAYKSFKALRSKDEEETSKWLKYWVIYALFLVAQYVLDIILPWVPLYYEAKFGFLLWLQLPQFNGANMLYTSFVEPVLSKEEAKIDDALANGGTLLKAKSSKLMASLSEKAGSLSSEVIKRTNKAKPAAEAD